MNFEKILASAESLVTEMPMFPATGFYSQCLIHTEPDSELRVFLEDDSRVEYCRDAYRANLAVKNDSGELAMAASFDYEIFELTDYSANGEKLTVTVKATQDLDFGNGKKLPVSLEKTFVVLDDEFHVKFTVTKLKDEKDPDWDRVLFMPELVNSVTPADDIDGVLESFVKINGSDMEKKIALNYQVTDFPKNGGFAQRDITETIFLPEELKYVLTIKTPLYGSFYDIHTYRFMDRTSGLMEDMEISPAVHQFYKDFVFEDHSRLGYHQSGAKITPIFKLSKEAETEFTISLTREIVEIGSSPETREGGIPLISYSGR
jgi:hypothetical protein